MAKVDLARLERKEGISLRPIDIILPAIDKPIDKLINAVYTYNNQAQAILIALRDPNVRRWPKQLQKDLCITMIDYRVIDNQIYYQDRLYVPLDDKLRL